MEIVRLRAFGRAGGGGTRRSSVLRGGASPALNDPALRGLIWAGVWPWSTAVACVVHWRARTGGAGLGTGSSTARAARRPRSSPERDAWAPRARQGLRDLAQKEIRGSAVLTEARERAVMMCRGGWRRRRAADRGGARGGRAAAEAGAGKRAWGRSYRRGGAVVLLGRGSGTVARRNCSPAAQGSLLRRSYV